MMSIYRTRFLIPQRDGLKEADCRPTEYFVRYIEKCIIQNITSGEKQCKNDILRLVRIKESRLYVKANAVKATILYQKHLA
jgi:hypothetical protein